MDARLDAYLDEQDRYDAERDLYALYCDIRNVLAAVGIEAVQAMVAEALADEYAHADDGIIF